MSLDEALEILKNWQRAAVTLHSRFSDPSTGMSHDLYVSVGSVDCFVLQLVDADTGVSTPRPLDGAAFAYWVSEDKSSLRITFSNGSFIILTQDLS